MLKTIELTGQDKHDLKVWLNQQEEITSFFHNIHMSTLIVSHTIQQEIGGINDNLARYLYVSDSKKKLPSQQLVDKIKVIGDTSASKTRLFRQ